MKNALEVINGFVEKKKLPSHFVLVDDGSTDGGFEFLEQTPLFQNLKERNIVKVVALPKNSGKGRALQVGVAEAEGTHILTLDADMSTPPSQLVEWMESESCLPEREIWVGSREHKNSQVKDRKHRKFVGNVFNLLIRCLTPLQVHDTQCGFKLYPNKIAKHLFFRMRTHGWAHDVELLYRAYLLKIPIKEMSIGWQAMEGSKVSVWRDSIRMFFQLCWISFYVRFQRQKKCNYDLDGVAGNDQDHKIR